MNGKKIIQIIGAVAVINLLSRLIGFFREVVVGYQFGTSYAADSVVTAYTLPNFFYVTIGGAVATAFISIYSKLGHPSLQQKYLERIFGWMALGLVIFTSLLIIFSDGVIRLLFPGLSNQEFELTSSLFKIMAPSTLFLILSMWFTGLLNVNKRFSWSAVSTLILNGSFLLIAVLLYPLLDAYAHAWGALISSFLMVIFLMYLIRKEKFFNFKMSFSRSPDTWKTFKLAAPILLGGATLQLYFLIHRFFGSFLDEGYIAALNYTSKIVQLPQSVLMTAVTTVVYPLLARKVAASDTKGIVSIYEKGLRIMGIIILPVSVFIVIYAESIIQAVFQYGNFNEDSTAMAVPLLQILVIGMFFHAANLYVTRFYYAYENSVYPVAASLFCVLIVNVGINLLVVNTWGAEGLAFGTSVSAIINFMLLTLGSRYILGSRDAYKKENRKNIMKLVLLLVIFSLVLAGWNRLVILANPYIDITSGLMLAAVILAVAMKGLRFEEWGTLENKVKEKLSKK